MSSNYPPGVTGNELEIAGPDYEEDEQVECRADDVSFVSMDAENVRHLDAAKALVSEYVSKGPPASFSRLMMELALVGGEKVDLPVCPFDGTVTVQGHQGRRWWTCPLCGTFHETEVDDGE